ncbi:ABC transporter ATP-binding protein [Pediococcus claussenii]|uniref:ABC transporter family protein n=1 Tax=Pediococcus claussenii (strain ATCC BAA-344 / DSM 14800 / JCM 18046 / KCTC 3811 / LMG 21948 / P06) TaxID=701521 RepID=G8PAU4_PEDCP|nr:ABC transporter ATP-binding protein [Pediococcus claussenii]AEV95812.1 ABC transporter family protein [Pediococcus claussenii ATCC BAA-344]ANZ69310.1 ABC transporter [Pediococcus claussenii]ANZ71130.1 ABC transporter [Pediococcus claussenii]KRN20419.1 hypothetical protein IV79_GL000474 [Pediococcus claussenii]
MKLQVKELTHAYDGGQPLYENVNLKFDSGKLYTIVGESGSGKTTLLSFLAGLDVPQKGGVYLEDINIRKIGLTNYRKRDVAIVFQQFNLLNYMSALDNILTALSITKSKHRGDRQYVLDMLNKVGINELDARKNVQLLSGGQQQRVAIVRAMLVDAPIVIADEPTGNLDSENSMGIVKMFQGLAHESGKTVIIITHDVNVAEQGDIKIQLKDHQFSTYES